MKTEISYKSSSIEVYGGRTQLLFAMFLDEQESFPWITDAFEDWKAALICGLTVELDECLKSPSELFEFLELTELVDTKLRGMAQKLSKSDLAKIDKGIFGSNSFVGDIETAKLVDTLRTIRTFLKCQIDKVGNFEGAAPFGSEKI